MTTMTDDVNTRLTAVELEVRNTNARLDDTNGQLSDIRADIRLLHARIDRLFWAIIGFGSGVILTMLGLAVTLILTA